MTESSKFPYALLLALAVAIPLQGCDKTDDQKSAGDPAKSSVGSDRTQTVAPAPEPTSTASSAAAASTTTAAEVVSRDRVLRAMTCKLVLGQSVGVKMSNADSGLPPDLAARLKVSAISRWEKFEQEHAEAAGVGEQDRVALIQSRNQLSSTAEDRQRTVDMVRDCLDNEP